MKTLRTQKRLATEVLKVGKNKVWFDPNRLNDIGEALTKTDMEELIKDKAIGIRPTIKEKERKRLRKERKKKRRKKQKGAGRIRKKVKKRKQDYIKKIRKLRKYIKYLRENNIITKKEYYELRKLAKAGIFRNQRHLREYVNKTLKKSPP